jgi:hypothetical protein
MGIADIVIGEDIGLEIHVDAHRSSWLSWALSFMEHSGYTTAKAS